MNAGFIGLGNLGKAMAQRLISQGVELTVWNRTPEKAQDLEAEVAASPADLIGGVPLVFVNVRDSTAVEAVLRGPEGLLQGDCTGKVIVDTTTNHFNAVTSFHQAAQERDATYLESPVVGSVGPAQQGTLTVFVSGTQSAFDQAKPYLEKIGSPIFFLGEPPGLATKMKLINNSVLASFMVTIAEALALGEQIGLDKERVLDLLSAGAGNSAILNAKREKLETEDFEPHFSAALMIKDLAHMEDLTEALGRPWLTGRVAEELFAMTRLKGLEDRDFSVVYRVLAER
jgi:3-hydroxyisobutyrate dehydrogenase